jgi:hypothetical protein
MKKRIILRFLVGVLLLFLTTSAWALDYNKYKMLKFEELPWQDCERVPITPQIIDNSPKLSIQRRTCSFSCMESRCQWRL